MMLAEQVGTLDVDGMLASIEPAQYREWIAYYAIKSGSKPAGSLTDSLDVFRGMAGA